MKPLFTCELNYTPNFHLMQVYTGFYALYRKGIIDLKVNFVKSNADTLPVTTVIVNNKHRVVFDCLDGGQMVKDIFKKPSPHKGYDFYFKRSYHAALQQEKPENLLIFPLGLNYNVQPDENLFSFNNNAKLKLEYFLKTNKLARKFFKKRFYYTKDFEYYPVKPAKNKILFITRLWDPEEAKSPRSKVLRQQYNELRIDCIEACKKEYGKMFTGGLYNEAYAKKNFSPLVISDALTNKASYLQTVKEHSICITTTGLHNSIGWKLAEYVAASRAIVTEPLHFDVTGNFSAGTNYLEFTTSDELLQQVELLLNDTRLMADMMQNNYYYYNNYLKPENLILNTLLTITDTTGKDLSPQSIVSDEFIA